MGAEENERQMANNVMREIRVVMGTWYVDFCVDARNGSLLEVKS